MMYGIVLLFGLVATVLGQDLSGIPGCALVCALGAGKAAGCGPGDVKCFCSSAAALAQAQSCVQSSCSESDAKKAVTGAANLCASVGVTPPIAARDSPAAGDSEKDTSSPAPAAAVSSASQGSSAPAAAAAASSSSVGGSAASAMSSTVSQASASISGLIPSSASASAFASKPAVFTGAAAAMNGPVRGAGVALAGVAILAAAL